MKRLRLTALFCTLTCLLSVPVLATGNPALITDTEAGEAAQVMAMATDEIWKPVTGLPSSADALQIGGTSAILMELSSGTILYEKNIHEALPIASVTKIMTMLLVMEAIDEGTLSMEDTVTCSATAASMGGSQIWLEENETMTVHDLLKAAAVVSANDACAALAEHLCGSIEGFVARMNERAAELSMNDTRFLDCSGLNDEGRSSAYDVALMSRELMTKHPDIQQFTTIWMDSLRGGKSGLVNTNKLVRHYSGATGLKTGTTSTAGHNLSATASRNGLSFAAVILGCKTTDERFGGARKMLDYGFANYSVYTPQADDSALTPVAVLRGEQETVQPQIGSLKPLLLKKGEEKTVSATITLADNVEAPVEKGQTIGTLTVSVGGEVKAEYPVVAATAVRRLTMGMAFYRLLAELCG